MLPHSAPAASPNAQAQRHKTDRRPLSRAPLTRSALISQSVAEKNAWSSFGAGPRNATPGLRPTRATPQVPRRTSRSAPLFQRRDIGGTPQSPTELLGQHGLDVDDDALDEGLRVCRGGSTRTASRPQLRAAGPRGRGVGARQRRDGGPRDDPRRADTCAARDRPPL